MNEDRRKKLFSASTKIAEAQSLVEDIKMEEEDSLENLPESMKEGEKGQKAEAAVEALVEAYDALDQALEHISTATE